tara:strand:- start:840 stop:1253 length:414 start_codon:yes stop_codon:yes gene_type:complete
MATYNYKMGLGNVGSFQTSGMPYVTGNLNLNNEFYGEDDYEKFTFDRVTRYVTIINKGPEDLKVAFSKNGIQGSNHLVMWVSSSLTLEMKLTELYMSGSSNCAIIAGLTGIQATAVNNTGVSPSGSNWSGSLGTLVG